MPNAKLFRITTVPLSLDKLLESQLKFMTSFYEVTAMATPEGEYLQRIGEREGVKVWPLELTRKITPIKDLKALWKLYWFLKKEKPLIVHTHTPKAGIIGMLAAKLAKVPIRLHTVAGLPLMEASGTKRDILNAVERLTYFCAHRVYPNSEGLRKIISAEKYCSVDKLKVIANGSTNGINTAYFNIWNNVNKETECKQRLNILESDFVFIFVGRLVNDKGISELVSAFSKLNQEDKTCKLLLVGPLESDLDPLDNAVLLEMEANSNIISVGYRQDVRPYFAISDALVFPSYREGFPNVVLQAGAMGLPSIVSDINGCNEIIKEGENGLIIPSKDTDALYHAMRRFVRDKELVKKLKSNARRMIVERYEQQVVWDALLAEYKRLEGELLNEVQND